MEFLKTSITKSLPDYLSALPIPDKFEGFKELSLTEWMLISPVLFTVLAIFLTPIIMSASAGSAKKPSRLNEKVSLEKEKVVDTCFVEDIEDMKAYCRCWKSKKFPYCDGAHTAHNKASGDNVGPLLVKEKK